MAIDFPSSPATGDVYNYGGRSWKWNGSAWITQNVAVTVAQLLWMMLVADYTLTSTTSAQKLFNTTTNGALTLPTGVYEFEALYYITGMSSTSGNASVSMLGGGTASIDRIGQQSVGLDNTTPTTAAAMGGSVSVNPGVNAAPAGAGTGLTVRVSGMFRVTAAGTIIPSISLANAAAAVVKAGSWFKCRKVGEATDTYIGNWS